MCSSGKCAKNFVQKNCAQVGTTHLTQYSKSNCISMSSLHEMDSKFMDFDIGLSNRNHSNNFYEILINRKSGCERKVT